MLESERWKLEVGVNLNRFRDSTRVFGRAMIHKDVVPSGSNFVSEI